LFCRNYPFFLQVRLKFSFFKLRRTVSRLMPGAISSWTFSVRILTVHLRKPAGGVPHTVAIIRASISPLTIGFLLDSVGVLNLKTSSSPSL
jgi:hypothetical protein